MSFFGNVVAEAVLFCCVSVVLKTAKHHTASYTLLDRQDNVEVPLNIGDNDIMFVKVVITCLLYHYLFSV